MYNEYKIEIKKEVEEKIISRLRIKNKMTLKGNYTIVDELTVEKGRFLKIENAKLIFVGCGITCKGSLEILNSILINLKNILLVNANATIINTIFKNGIGRMGNEINSLIGSFYKDDKILGEAILCRYSTVSTKNCRFLNCHTDFGGAIKIDNGSNVKLVECEFKDCSAKQSGGALYIVEKSNVTINNCTFEKCNACYGSAIYIKKNIIYMQ